MQKKITDWKSKLKVEYSKESWGYKQTHGLRVELSHKGFPLIRQYVKSKGQAVTRLMTKIEKDEAIINARGLLEQWVEEHIKNYDELSKHQKRRLSKIEPVRQYGVEKYATIKYLKVRIPCNGSYKLGDITVLIELK